MACVKGNIYSTVKKGSPLEVPLLLRRSSVPVVGVVAPHRQSPTLAHSALGKDTSNGSRVGAEVRVEDERLSMKLLHHVELHVSGKADQRAEARKSVKLSVLCSFWAFFDIFSVRSL